MAPLPSESEIRSLEERSTSYWLLLYLSREKMESVLNAMVLDKKGTIELDEYYVRGKLSEPGTAEPGTTLRVKIESVDPLRSEIRFKRG